MLNAYLAPQIAQLLHTCTRPGSESLRHLIVLAGAGRGPQVFGVFNSLLGAVVKNSRIEFDDDWEEKSNVAATGSRLLRCPLPPPRSAQLSPAIPPHLQTITPVAAALACLPSHWPQCQPHTAAL